MVRILLRVGRCPKVAGDPSRLRSEVKILWAYRDQWATITHVNSWSMYFVLVRWSILEFGMMLHADQRGFNGSLVDVCRCRIGNSDFWKLNQGGFRCLRRLMTDGAIYTSTAHCFCMLFVTLFYLNLLRHCQRLTHYCNVTTRIGWNWYVFTVKLLNVYWISFMSRMFLLISSTARFEFLHLCRWRCVLHLWTWKEFLGKCRNQQFHINLALRVVSLWLNLCILHIITYLYIIYILYTYLHCIILKWWLADQNSEVKHVDVQSVLVYLLDSFFLLPVPTLIGLYKTSLFPGVVGSEAGYRICWEAFWAQKHVTLPFRRPTPSAMPPGGVG